MSDSDQDRAPRRESVFLGALGADVAHLQPEVRRYVEGSSHGVVSGDGVFEVAGSRFRQLGLLVRPFVGPRALVTRFESDVPFSVVNQPTVSATGVSELHAVRVFHFRGGEQSFVDLLRPGPVPGTLRNVLGERGRVELELRCDASPAGNLRLRSERVWLRIGPIRVRLPRLLSVRVEVEDGHDRAIGRQTVKVRATNPILGTVLEYRGTFSFHVESSS